MVPSALNRRPEAAGLGRGNSSAGAASWAPHTEAIGNERSDRPRAQVPSICASTEGVASPFVQSMASNLEQALPLMEAALTVRCDVS